MGTNNSRPKITKVTPKEDQPFHQAASPRMITAAQHLPQHQQGIVGHQQISHLPPLKQRVPQIAPSSPDSENPYAKPTHSIIKSHPPQRAKAWQPIPCPTELPAASKASDEHVSMPCQNCGDCGFCPRNTKCERNQKGFLQAQTLLIGQATKKRRSHQRHLKEQRRIYTSSVGGVGNEQIRIVSRPTQKDIFWDETKGQKLDLTELLQPSPPGTEPDSGMEEMIQQPQSNFGLSDYSGGFSRDLNESVTKSPERRQQHNLPWLEDFRKHEQKHVNSWDVLEGW